MWALAWAWTRASINANPGPIQTQHRSPLPDVLRGLSLLGILTVNMQDFAGYHEWQQRGLDGVAQVLIDVLANGRFISIFAMLFGWGAAGLIAQHGARFFVRRHLVLLLVGALHFVLLWHGDIISLYALTGLSLLLVVRLNAGALLAVALVSGGWWLFTTLQEARPYLHLALPRTDYLPNLAGQTYAQDVAARAHDFVGDWLGGSVYNGPWIIALFCLGAAAQRTGLLTRPQEHMRLLRGLAYWGGGVGLVLGVALAWLNTRADFGSGLLAIPVRMSGGLAGGLGYVGALGLLAASGRLGRWQHFGGSGRIAMSNYIAQSLVMTTVFYPYAGHQWGKWGAAAALALALAFGLLQVALSGVLVRRFGTGPLERLVRWAVYGR